MVVHRPLTSFDFHLRFFNGSLVFCSSYLNFASPPCIQLPAKKVFSSLTGSPFPSTTSWLRYFSLTMVSRVHTLFWRDQSFFAFFMTLQVCGDVFFFDPDVLCLSVVFGCTSAHVIVGGFLFKHSINSVPSQSSRCLADVFINIRFQGYVQGHSRRSIWRAADGAFLWLISACPVTHFAASLSEACRRVFLLYLPKWSL